MATPYENIYDRFLNKVTDYYIFDLSDKDVTTYCHKLLLSALANLPNIEADLTKLDEVGKQFEDDLTNLEQEYVAIQMVCEWIDPQINNTTLTRQMIGTSEMKFYAQSNQIEKLMELRTDLMARSKKMRRNYNYSHSDYFAT